MRGYRNEPSGSAFEIGSKLHELALQYWADGRIADAKRVAVEAARLLEAEESASSLRDEVASTLEAMDRL